MLHNKKPLVLSAHLHLGSNPIPTLAGGYANWDTTWNIGLALQDYQNKKYIDLIKPSVKPGAAERD